MVENIIKNTLSVVNCKGILLPKFYTQITLSEVQGKLLQYWGHQVLKFQYCGRSQVLKFHVLLTTRKPRSKLE